MLYFKINKRTLIQEVFKLIILITCYIKSLSSKYFNLVTQEENIFKK